VTGASSPRIVIGFDGSDPAKHAIETAGRLIPGARATVVTVRDSWVPLERAAFARIALPDSVIVPAARELERELEQSAQATAEQGRALARSAGLDADCFGEPAGMPWHGLATVAGRLGADAIVCGARGCGGLARAVLGTTTDALLHHAETPVLVIPSEDTEVDGPLVLGYDGSEPSRDAIKAAAHLFRGRRALVVHAWSSPVRRSFAGEALLGTPTDEVQQVAQGLEDMFSADASELSAEGCALARDLGLGAEPAPVESPVGVWRALDRVATTERAAAIVVGCRGRGALASTVLGSVSSGLVHNATPPVLVARRPARAPG
jgi:nucleotide-binding universal stress UspA family protein